MSLPLLAALLLVAAQDSVTTQPQEPVASGSAPTTDTATPADPPRAEAQDEETGRSEEVCRRVAVYDDFGRQRSRRVCRPR